MKPLFLLSAASAVLAAQTGLQADLPILKQALWDLHPGLYRYNTPADMERHFSRLTEAVSASRNLRDEYVALAGFLASIRCGHTFASFYNQPEQIGKQLFQGRDRLPIYFRWIGGKMIVTRNFSTAQTLRPGAEVLEINGVRAEDVLKKLLTYVSADGGNDVKRLNALGVTGRSQYEPFDVYYPLLYPLHGTEYTLRVKPWKGKVVNVRVPALSYEQRLAPVKEEMAATRGSVPLWSFRFLKPGSGYLRMPTWVTYNSKWNWEGYLDEVFGQLGNAKELIIDVRGNEGGSEIGAALVSRFIDREIVVGGEQRFVRYREAPAALLPYLDTWDPSFKNWGNEATATGDGFYTLKKYETNKGGVVIRPNGPRFPGKVYVLVDGTNSSATFQFAQIMQQFRLGTLVGDPTGGNQRGINGSSFFFLRLPNSKLEVDLPLVGIFPKEQKPDAGLEPDILAPLTVRDVALGQDPALRKLGVQ